MRSKIGIFADDIEEEKDRESSCDDTSESDSEPSDYDVKEPDIINIAYIKTMTEK
jgi:hypothetical protein